MDEIEQAAADAARMAAEGGQGTQVAPPPLPDYAKLYAEQQAQTAIMQQQLNQALALAQAQQVNQHHTVAPPAPVDPFAAFDPEAQKAMRAVADSIKAEFNGKLAATQAQVQAAQLQAELTNLPPAIQQRAKIIFEGMSKNGTPLNAADARRFAVGEAVEAGTWNPTTATVPRNAPAVVPGGSRGVPANKTRAANFDSLSRSQQNAILEAEGIGEQEF